MFSVRMILEIIFSGNFPCKIVRGIRRNVLMALVTSLDLTQHYTRYDLVPPLLMSTQLLIGSFSKTAQPSSLAIGKRIIKNHHDWSI